jgi:hypothetical protein
VLGARHPEQEAPLQGEHLVPPFLHLLAHFGLSGNRSAPPFLDHPEPNGDLLAQDFFGEPQTLSHPKTLASAFFAAVDESADAP